MTENERHAVRFHEAVVLGQIVDDICDAEYAKRGLRATDILRAPLGTVSPLTWMAAAVGGRLAAA